MIDNIKKKIKQASNLISKKDLQMKKEAAKKKLKKSRKIASLGVRG
jgi:hypothetical protein